MAEVEYKLEKLTRIKAVVWLHLVRSRRYFLDMVNWGIVDFMWISIYILAALSFTPRENYPEVVPIVFWAMFAWSLMSMPVWTIGNWVRFYVSMGVYEENELASINHSIFLFLRILPALLVSLVATASIALLLRYVTGINPLVAREPVLLVASLLGILSVATIYSLILAYLGLILSVPAPLLDFASFLFFILGGVGIPVEKLPSQARPIALATPYSHFAEVMRYSITSVEPYLGLEVEGVVALVYLLVLVLLLKIVSSYATRKTRREGVKGIGRT